MNFLNSESLKGMLKSGAANLYNDAEQINTLNVFPVPDGDTGTNMSMTFTNGYKEAEKCASSELKDVAKALSKGLLMGARGNSGVITSQIFRGFYQYIDKNKVTEMGAKELAEAFENGSAVAYKAIMKPVEGTILTVIRESSWYAHHDFEENQDMDVNGYFDLLVKYAKESLDRTPDLLPVLKEVGVVDSGGAGLLKILEGFKAYLDGNPVEFNEAKSETTDASVVSGVENDEFGYCTEFILRLNKNYGPDFDENRLKNKLAKIGESLVVVKDEDLIKVHVHTLTPGEALNMAQRYGEFIKLKIENMQEQHSSLTQTEEKKPEKKHQKYGVIAVASGQGMVDLFKQCHVDIVISGGQTMNPSCEDFVSKIEELDNCDEVIIFPNNSNIILAATQAKEICSDRQVTVVPTKSLQAGLSALSSFDPDGSLEANLEEFEYVISTITEGSLTYAIKDTVMDGISVKEGDYIAMSKKKIVSSDPDKMTVIRALLDELMANEEAEIMVVIAGEGSEKSEMDEIKAYIEENSELEVEVFKGDQPVYSYLFAAE